MRLLPKSPDLPSPTPYTYHAPIYAGGPDWIEDARGFVVVEYVGAQDRPFIVAACNKAAERARSMRATSATMLDDAGLRDRLALHLMVQGFGSHWCRRIVALKVEDAVSREDKNDVRMVEVALALARDAAPPASVDVEALRRAIFNAIDMKWVNTGRVLAAVLEVLARPAPAAMTDGERAGAGGMK